MNTMRSIIAIVAGITVAFLLVAAIEAAGHVLYPPPPGIDLKNPEELRLIISKLPFGAIVAVLIAWACGSFGGALVAALLAGRRPWIHAFIVGSLLMVAAIATMLVFPHPAWFVITALIVLVAFTSLGAGLGQRLTRSPGSREPQPYDMRKKNMAC